jgi:LysM repeat protein
MWDGNPVTYTSPDRHKTVVARYEHTMILIGYEPGKVHMVDAYTGWTQSYPLRSFMRSWNTLGRMAITGSAPMPEATAEANQETPVPSSQSVYLPFVLRQVFSEQAKHEIPAAKKTYTVRRGDYLAAVARRYGVNWRDLAEHNGIEFPYVIYAGQILKIP